MYLKTTLEQTNILDLLLQIYFKHASAQILVADFLDGVKANIVVKDGEEFVAETGKTRGVEVIDKVKGWKRGVIVVMDLDEHSEGFLASQEPRPLLETLLRYRKGKAVASKAKFELSNALLTSYLGSLLSHTFPEEEAAQKFAALTALLSSEVAGLIEALGLEEFSTFSVYGKEKVLLTTTHEKGYASVEIPVSESKGADALVEKLKGWS